MRLTFSLNFLVSQYMYENYNKVLKLSLHTLSLLFVSPQVVNKDLLYINAIRCNSELSVKGLHDNFDKKSSKYNGANVGSEISSC